MIAPREIKYYLSAYGATPPECAATALRHVLHVMTRNTADFEPTGVLLVNPWKD
jgi:hypothetical protein